MSNNSWSQWTLINQFEPVDHEDEISRIELKSEKDLTDIIHSMEKEKPTLLILKHASGKSISVGIGAESAGVLAHWDTKSQRGLYAQPITPNSGNKELFYCEGAPISFLSPVTLSVSDAVEIVVFITKFMELPSSVTWITTKELARISKQ